MFLGKRESWLHGLLVSALTGFLECAPCAEAAGQSLGPQVVVEASVTTPAGRPIAGLACDDFRLLDNRREQKLSACQTDPRPLNLVLVVDGRSLRAVWNDDPFWKDIQTAVRTLGRADRVALLRLNDGNLEWVQDFTNDFEAVLRSVNSERARPRAGPTRQPLFEAVTAAGEKLQTLDDRARRAIIVLSDSIPRGSTMPADPAAAAALKARAGVWLAILDRLAAAGPVLGLPPPLPQIVLQPRGTRTYEPPMPGRDDLVMESGGELIRASASPRVATLILARLRGRYALSYDQPSTKEGEFRRVEVELSDSGKRKHPDATVRAPLGYYPRSPGQ